MSEKFTTSDVKLVSLDGVLTWKVRCPLCHEWGHCDDDQFYGRVSLRCGNPGCTFHQIVDLSEVQ